MKKILSLAVLLGVCLFLKAQNQLINPYPRTISVTGSAEMEIVPDEIYVQVDLREYKKRNEKTDLETIKTNFLNACKAIGIPDSVISIAAYEGYNFNYWYWRKRKKDPDMLAAISYQVKLRESKKMDELIDQLDDEATANFQIVKTSHSHIQEFRKQLKMQAVKAAKEKGVYLTESINEKLGEAVTITEPEEYHDIFYAQDKPANTTLRESKASGIAMQTETGNGGGGIDFKKMKLKYDVTIVFALK